MCTNVYNKPAVFTIISTPCVDELWCTMLCTGCVQPSLVYNIVYTMCTKRLCVQLCTMMCTFCVQIRVFKTVYNCVQLCVQSVYKNLCTTAYTAVYSIHQVDSFLMVSTPAPRSSCRPLLRPLHAIAGGCRESWARLPLPLARGPLNAVRNGRSAGEGRGSVDKRGGQGQTASSDFIDSLSLVQDTLAGLLKPPQA